MTDYTETRTVDLIQVLEHGHVQVRIAHRVLADGHEIAKNYERLAVDPGSDIAHLPPYAQIIATAAWTPEVLETWKKLKQARDAA